MWSPGKSLSAWAGCCLAILVICGCGARRDPYAHQVQRVNLLAIQGEQYFSQGDLPRAARDFAKALELSRAVDYPAGVAQQLNNLGAVALEQGDLKRAEKLFTQALTINESQGNWVEATTNQANLATVAQKAGDRERAEHYLHAAQEAAQRSNSPPALGRVLCRWAGFSLDRQDPAAARTFLDEAQRMAKTPALKGALHHQWGRLFLSQGDTAAALDHFTQALQADRQVLDRGAMAADLFLLGETQQRRGDLAQAFLYYGRAFDVYAGLGKKTPLQECLKRLKEVNSQGRLGNSLERFEKHPQLTPS